MRYFIYTIISFSFIISLSSCEDVIDLDLPTAEERLVVEANLDFSPDNLNDTLYIKLSLTTDYYNKEIPKAHNAIVWVEDSKGNKSVFKEINNSGTYISASVDKNSNNGIYKLHIDYKNNIYEATEKLITTPPIVEVKQTREKFFNKDYYVIRAFYKDTHRENSLYNYYYTKYTRNNDKIHLSAQSNEHTKGNLIENIYIDEDTEVGDSINIKISQVSHNYYDFLKQLITTIDNGGGPFQVPPGQLKGNVKNISDPTKDAFGYFRVTEVQSITHIVYEQSKP